MKYLSIILAIFFLPLHTVQSQLTVKGPQAAVKIQWMSMDEVLEKMEKEPRKIILDIYTSSCKVCDRMDAVTYNDPKVVQYINSNFYAVKFDSKELEDLSYRERSSNNAKNSKQNYQDLARKLMEGKFSFPTVAFLDEQLNLIQCIGGFKTPEQFEKISSYFADDHYRKVPWSAFLQMYPQLQKE